jgi:hypothetical protein
MALVALAPRGPAFGWGPRAHRIATRIAVQRLTPKAAAAVRELLHEGDTLVDVADWADHEGHDAVPGSAPWHYVNVPITAKKYDAKYCPERGCVVSKIKHYRKVLADRNAPRRERQRALLFLVHLVEDLNQPLHVGDNGDRGGNLTQVQFLGEGDNLHRLWDSALIDRSGQSERDWTDQVAALVTPEHVKEWSKGDVEDWADESLDAARRAYYYPVGAARPLPSGTRLGEDYARLARPIVRERLARAGVRLANELNEIFR